MKSTPILLAILLLAAAAFAEASADTTAPALAEDTARVAGPAEQVPSLGGAFGRSLVGTYPFAVLGGVSWGLNYAGADREAKIAGTLQATGVWTLFAGSLGYLAYCPWAGGRRTDPGCAISQVMMPLGLVAFGSGTVYGFLSIPGAVDRARVKAGYPSRMVGAAPKGVLASRDTLASAEAGDSGAVASPGDASKTTEPRPVDARRLEPPPTKTIWLAYPLALGATVIPLSMAGNYSPGVAVALAGTALLLGPSAGQFYAGSPRQAWLGVAIRAAAVPVAFVSHQILPDNPLPPAAVLLGGIAYSLVDTWFAVERFNEREAKAGGAATGLSKASIAPALFPLGKGRVAPGLAFSTTF